MLTALLLVFTVGCGWAFDCVLRIARPVHSPLFCVPPAEVLDPSASLSLLIERLPSADVRPPYDGPKAGALQATLGQLQRACTRVAAPQLAAVLPMLMPQLCNCYNSASAKVRRATVECLVGAWMAVGAEAVEPYVSELTLAQRKLLEIYVERAQSTAS